MTCEAAYMLSPEQLQSLGISTEELGIMYSVATSLANVVVDSEGYPSVSWSFSGDEGSFDKYIGPWSKSFPPYYSDQLASAKGIVPWLEEEAFDTPEGLLAASFRPPSTPSQGEVRARKLKYLEGMEYWDAFFRVTTVALSRQGLRKMENEFAAWAMPRALGAGSKISNIVPASILESARGGVEAQTTKENDQSGGELEE